MNLFMDVGGIFMCFFFIIRGMVNICIEGEGYNFGC